MIRFSGGNFTQNDPVLIDADLVNIPHICHFLYTGKIFGVNYDKRISRQNSVNRDLLGQANYKDQDYTKFVTHRV